MFGLICGCYLGPGPRQHWTAHYCGLCLALKTHHGHLSRLAVNGDAALLSVLCEAQSPIRFETKPHSCPFHGFRPVSVTTPGTVGARYGAAMSVLMGASKILDHIADRETGIKYFPALFSSLAGYWQRAARRTSHALGFDTALIETQMRRQAVAEQVPDADFLFYSRPTERASGAACRHTALLCGVPRNAVWLEQMGQAFGRILYLTDSYRDYCWDIETGRFNALARSFPKGRIRQESLRLFHTAHEALKHSFDKLTLATPSLAAHLFLDKIGQIGARTFSADPDQIDLDLSPENKKEGWCKRFCDCCDCCECCECGDACDCGCGGADGCGCGDCACDGCCDC
ncbi:hypothetical protein DENIS_0597 [Desulfonema ishimotonii]|uniref:Uncharacterized protein n=1 Tax=Desulfonema ishimotonii TaxID=45657 RepID=A0A401FRR7_9BACT|nr:DUF5685 family protein [Desulfonema ishimotonii]GBC59656.1 hypothetical protein DENIS_0597 [Desulfonema ishimotonii]